MLLMSANGVDAESTAYQRTKRNAERYLEASGLDWTIFRPSVIFGDPRDRMEFATQLKRDIIDSPLPAPLFFSGVNPAIHRLLHLGGPHRLSWQQILQTIAAAAGRDKTMMPVPAFGVSTAAALLDRWDQFPITRDQLHMLMQGNHCDPTDLAGLGIDPIPFSAETLAYLTAPTEDASTCQQNAA